MKQPIQYAVHELNGIPVRPHSQSVMRRAVAGQPIELGRGKDYINLYHVFERMQAADRSLRKLKLVRRQLGPSKWLLFVVPIDDAGPQVRPADGYDPKRGRYKRYAERLAAGEALPFDGRGEAVKARRAWQLYVPKAERKHLRSSVWEDSSSQRYCVVVRPRD